MCTSLGKADSATDRPPRASERRHAGGGARMFSSRSWSVAVLAVVSSAFGAAGTPAAESDSAGAQKFMEMRTFVAKRNEQNYRVTTPQGIDEARYVSVGGIDQYISIRGEDRDNPVILFLHGGPGDATNPWGY